MFQLIAFFRVLVVWARMVSSTCLATYEEVRKMTGHTTNKAFDRYIQLEGESMRALYARRRQAADNELINGSPRASMPQTIGFIQKAWGG